MDGDKPSCADVQKVLTIFRDFVHCTIVESGSYMPIGIAYRRYYTSQEYIGLAR